MSEVKTEKAERQTIEAIRNDKNTLLVTTDKKWPNMYFIKLENGGNIPPDLRGLYTSQMKADQAILKHLG